MKKKRNLIGILFLLIGVGVTLAYFTSTSTLDNEFKSGRYKTVITDNFTSPNDWKPGDTTPKTITTKNEGTMPVRVRVKLTESWKSENGDDLPLIINTGRIEMEHYEPVSIINFANVDDWVQDGDYYYYIGELEPGDETSSLIESVTYNPNTPSDMNCTSVNGVYNCKSTGDGYDGGTYTLNAVVETVQSESALSAWNLSYDPTEEKIIYDISDNHEYSTYETTNKNIFLRKTLFGQTLKQTDVGFIINDNVYYLKGESQVYYNQIIPVHSSYYEENKQTLKSAFGNTNCEEEIFDDDYNTRRFSCTKDDYSAYVSNYAQIEVDNYDGWMCYIHNYNSSKCITSNS